MKKVSIGKKFIRTKMLCILTLICFVMLQLFDAVTGYFEFNLSLQNSLFALLFMLIVIAPIGLFVDLYVKYKNKGGRA